MDRILKFVEREVRGLHETAYLLGLFALLSTFLAFFRDRLLAASFGAGETLDIYYAAFRIPDIVFIAVASLVSVFILVPILTQSTKEEERHALIGNIVTAFSLAMIGITVLLWIATPFLATLIFPALVAKDTVLITLTRILLLQPFFLGLSGVIASVTQVHGRYLLYAIGPLLYNASIILGIITFYPLWGLSSIAYGVVLGAVLHMGIQIPFALRRGYLRRVDFTLDFSQLRHVVATSIPRTLSMASNNIALFALIIIAATLGAGSVSVFSLAFNLQMAPLSIIGASYSVAAFPILARFFAHGETEHFCNQVITATRHILFWSIPLIGLAIVLRAHIVRIVLGSGAFDWADTRLTAAALALFIISLAAQALSLLFVRGYYAAGETLKPLVVNVSTAVGTVVSGYGLLIWFQGNEVARYFTEALLRVEGITGVEILMLPLAYALFAIVNAVIFMIMFERDFGILWKHIRRTLFNSVAAGVFGAFFARQALFILDDVFNINTFIGVFLIAVFAWCVGVFGAWATFKLLKSKELGEIGKAAHNKFWRFVPIIRR
tara:strand:+ start:14175 stop:15827 length:1653 start_codon:yes stop_codon:yes gene_type:complete